MIALRKRWMLMVLIGLVGSVASGQDPAPKQGESPVDVLNRRLQLIPPVTPVDPPHADMEPDAEAIREILGELRPILRMELRVMTSAAQPSPVFHREIAVEGANALRESARELNGSRIAGKRAGLRRETYPDPRKQVQTALVNACSKRLTPEQTSRYRLELDQRVQDDRRTMAANLVELLDRSLSLSTEQRANIQESLLVHWMNTIYPTLKTITLYGEFFPPIPEDHIVGFLSKTQVQAWRMIPKMHFWRPSYVQGDHSMAEEAGVEDADEKAAFESLEKKP